MTNRIAPEDNTKQLFSQCSNNIISNLLLLQVRKNLKDYVRASQNTKTKLKIKESITSSYEFSHGSFGIILLLLILRVNESQQNNCAILTL